MTQATVEDNSKPSGRSRIWRWSPTMTARRWQVASGLCVVAAAWFAFWEKLPVSITDETPLYVATRNGKQGVVTTGGRVVVPFVWAEVAEFDNRGMATVTKADRVGVIDRSGQMIIPAILSESAGRFDDHNQYVGIDQGHLVIYDRSGTRVLDTEWIPLAGLKFDSHDLLAAKKWDHIGWIDRDGVLRVRAPAGLTPVSNFETNGLAVVRNGEGKQGCVDLNGQTIVAAEWAEVFAGGWRTWGRNGEALRDDNLIEIQADKTQVFSNRLRTRGFLSRNGNMLIPATFEFVFPDGERKLAVVNDTKDKWGCVDFEGNTLVPMEYDKLSMFNPDGIAAAEKDGKHGWINLKGEVVIPFEYDDVSRSRRLQPFDRNGLAIVQKDGQWGAIDTAGKTVIPFEYSRGSHCGQASDWLGFARDGRCGCFDHQGQIVVPFEYGLPISFEVQGLAVTTRNGENVVIGSDGRQHHATTGFGLTALFHDLQVDDVQASIDLHKTLAAGRFLQARSEIGDGYGCGVFSADDGVVIPPLYRSIWMTRYGFKACEDRRESFAFLTAAMPSLRPWLKTILPSSNAADSDSVLEVLYDFEGRTIWRSDARSYDVMKAWGFVTAGVYSGWLWRRRRASERAAKRVNER